MSGNIVADASGAITDASPMLDLSDDGQLVSSTPLEQTGPGLYQAEIADFTGWSAANVKVRAFRARGALRKLMEKTK